MRDKQNNKAAAKREIRVSFDDAGPPGCGQLLIRSLYLHASCRRLVVHVHVRLNDDVTSIVCGEDYGQEIEASQELNLPSK